MTTNPSLPGSISVPVLVGNEIVEIVVGPEKAHTNTAAIAALASTFDNNAPFPVTTTVGTTLSAASFLSGLIVRSGPTGAYSDATDTAAALALVVNPVSYPVSFYIDIQNTTAFAETITGGTGVTVAAGTVLAPNSVGEFLVQLMSATAATMTRIFSGNLSDTVSANVTALTTVGAGVITGAGIAGGITTRGGAQIGTPFADTTDTAAAIIAAQPNAAIGQSWEWCYVNNTNAVATIGGGSGVTVSVNTIVPQNTWARYVVTYTAATTITIAAYSAGLNQALPVSQIVTNATSGAATAAVGDITGAQFCNLIVTAVGAANYTTRTGAQMFADIPNAQIGDSWMIAIRNTNAGTTTITAGASGVTINGTATIAQNVTRLFQATITAANTIVMQSMGISAAGA